MTSWFLNWKDKHWTAVDPLVKGFKGVSFENMGGCI